MAVVGGVVVVPGPIVLVTTFSADARSTVEFATDHLVVCAVILAVGVAEVVGYHQLLRGLSLDAPNSSGGT